MSTVIQRYDVYGMTAAVGGDPVAYVSITPPSFQAGESVSVAFLEHVKTFVAAQQGVASVLVRQTSTVTTDI